MDLHCYACKSVVTHLGLMLNIDPTFVCIRYGYALLITYPQHDIFKYRKQKNSHYAILTTYYVLYREYLYGKCIGPSCGGVDWGQLSAVPATDSALEGGLSPAKGPVID